MALPASDTFTSVANQALATYSASWTVNSGAVDVIGATDDCLGGSAGTENLAHWNADAFSNDQYSQFSISSGLNSNDSGPAVRVAASAETGYISVLTSGTSDIYKIVATAFTRLGGIATIVSNGDTMRMEASGTSISLKRNGTLFVGAFTDSAIAAGSAGMWLYSNDTARIDNFAGGNLGGAATTAPPILHRAYRIWKKRR